MINQEDVNKAYIKYAKGHLKECPECNQRALKVYSSLTDYGNNSFKCVFCGYYRQSNWTSCIHGKFYKKDLK